MTNELKPEHKTLDEAINYHLTWFEYNLNMGHLATRYSSSIGSAAESYFGQAAIHATILAELRHQAAKR